MAADWETFAEAMQTAGYEVRAVDLWAFVEKGGCSFDEFAAELCAQARADDRRPVLCGYSLGGRLALHALLANTACWSAAVIVSAHPGLIEEEERVMRMAHDAQWAARALSGNWQKFVDDWNAQGVLGDSGSELGDRAELEQRREAVVAGFVEWSLGKQEDLRARLRDVNAPVLWITGAADEKFSTLARAVGQTCPRVRHEVVPECGHRVPWEKPDDFAERVISFLGTS